MGSLRTLINTIKTKLDTIEENAKPFDVHDDVDDPKYKSVRRGQDTT